MVLKRRCQADDALGNQGRGFGKRMGGLDLRIGELIEPPRRARDRVFPDRRASVSGPMPSATKSLSRSIPRAFRRSRARVRWALVDGIDR